MSDDFFPVFEPKCVGCPLSYDTGTGTIICLSCSDGVQCCVYGDDDADWGDFDEEF